MNDNDILNEVIKSYATSISNPLMDGSMLTTVASNTVTSNAITGASIVRSLDIDDIMDQYSMNRIAVDHKVTSQELLKLQEVAPDFASEIKENIAKNLARDITKKVMFKKKFDKDADVHHFIGRVWVFTDDELKELLKDKNVY